MLAEILALLGFPCFIFQKYFIFFFVIFYNIFWSHPLQLLPVTLSRFIATFLIPNFISSGFFVFNIPWILNCVAHTLLGLLPSTRVWSTLLEATSLEKSDFFPPLEAINYQKSWIPLCFMLECGLIWLLSFQPYCLLMGNDINSSASLKVFETCHPP